VRIRAQGEGGIVVELGQGVDPVLNARVHALAAFLRGRLGDRILELVPSYRSLLVLHDPLTVPRGGLVRRIERLAAEAAHLPASALRPPRVVRIPVCYGGELGPDLDDLARHAGLPPAEVVALHAAPVYRVYLLGFTPGFPYLGGLSPRLACPRLATPRARTPAGSVAIGGEQTGVYPVESPGGWRILGRTPLRLFDPAPGAARPFLLAAGDGLRFVPIDRAAFDALAGEVEARRAPPPEVEPAPDEGSP
jgi:inhibitor of KinA